MFGYVLTDFLIMYCKNKISIFFVFFCLITATCLQTAGIDTVASRLGEIEKFFFGYTYQGSNESRILRLEKNLYGKSNSGSQKQRTEKIYKDMNLDVKVSANTPEKEESPVKTNFEIGPKADAGIKYPVVDKMEEKVFDKSYPDDDIYLRLSRLEKQTFKKESALSLNERVGALRDKILGGNSQNIAEIDPVTEEIILENGRKYIENPYIGNSSSDSHYNYYSYESSKNRIPVQDNIDDTNLSDSPDIYAERYAQNYDLDILEKQLFGKRFIQEPPSKRLARLENKVFQRTFNDNEEARTQRLLAVTTAQKTSKAYDSNKWAQRLNTGIQIGSILLMVLAMIL